MKEFFELLKKGKLRAIFLDPTDNSFLQFFRYLFVGGIATVVDWCLSFGTEVLLRPLVAAPQANIDYIQITSSSTGEPVTVMFHQQLIYIIATTVGFAGGLTTNFLLSRAFVFGAKKARAKTKAGEFFGHFTVGAIGLGMSYLIVWVGTSFILKGNYPVFRIAATVIVFIWNYLARKFFVYKK